MFYLLIAALGWIAWKFQAVIFLIVLALLFGGCTAVETNCQYDAYGNHFCTKTYYFDDHSHTEKVIAQESPKQVEEETIIYIEQAGPQPVCSELYYYNVPHDGLAYSCHYYNNSDEECDWYIGWGCYETWYWDNYECDWYYLYTYCQ